MALNAKRLFNDIVETVETKITESENFKAIQRRIEENKELVSEEDYNAIVPKYRMDESQKAMWEGITEAIVTHILENLEIVGIEAKLTDPSVSTEVETTVNTTVTGTCTGSGLGTSTCSGTGTGTGTGNGSGEVNSTVSVQSNSGRGLVR